MLGDATPYPRPKNSRLAIRTAEATAVPNLECERVYSVGDNVHSWTVKFWPNQPRPEAHYVRLHMRDPLKNYDEKKAKNH